jgi:hypothetical protein
MNSNVSVFSGKREREREQQTRTVRCNGGMGGALLVEALHIYSGE